MFRDENAFYQKTKIRMVAFYIHKTDEVDAETKKNRTVLRIPVDYHKKDEIDANIRNKNN